MLLVLLLPFVREPPANRELVIRSLGAPQPKTLVDPKFRLRVQQRFIHPPTGTRSLSFGTKELHDARDELLNRVLVRRLTVRDALVVLSTVADR